MSANERWDFCHVSGSRTARMVMRAVSPCASTLRVARRGASGSGVNEGNERKGMPSQGQLKRD